MIDLTNPATGHQISVEEDSADFWKAAGYRAAQKSSGAKQPAKKAAAKKTSSK